MADIYADVHHLWTTKAAFPTLSPGAKYKTTAYDSTLKVLMMKDQASDAIASEWSDDTLQCLLAGAQDVAGVKTFTNGLKVSASQFVGVTGAGGLSFDASNNASFSGDVLLAKDLFIAGNKLLQFGGSIDSEKAYISHNVAADALYIGTLAAATNILFQPNSTNTLDIADTLITAYKNIDFRGSLAGSKTRVDAGDGGAGTPGTAINAAGSFMFSVTPTGTNVNYTLSDGDLNGQIIHVRNMSGSVTARIYNADELGQGYISLSAQESKLMVWDSAASNWYLG